MIDFIGYWLFRGIGAILRALPIESALALARVVGWIAALAQVRAALAYANIKSAFPGRFTGSEIRSLIRANYMNLTQNIVEMFWFPKMNQEYAEKYVTIPNVERYFNCKRAGRGTALMTAHFGNWELLNIRTCFLGIPIVVIVRYQKRPRMHGYLTRLRECRGSRMIQKGYELREIVKAIRANEMIGFLSDQSGGKTGVPVRFFGRLTTSPPGAIQIALRTGAKALPVFIVRKRGPYHTVHVEEEMELKRTGDEEKDVQTNMQDYISLLERYISQWPHQWFWLNKRWKHNWTKRIVILSDGKAGHLSQSKAILRLFKRIEESEGRYEFSTQIIEVKYRNRLARFLFPLFTFFFMPFAQGRLHWLSLWLYPETFAEFKQSFAEIVISCGASVLPLNFLLKQECLAKNIVVMKPCFPFSLLRPNLVVVPEHDRMKESSRVVFTRTALSLIDPAELKQEGEAFRKNLNLDHEHVVSMFLGGKTKGYDFDEKLFESALESLDGFLEKNSCHLLMTTSRRTGKAFEESLKKRYSAHSKVPLVVIAREHNPEGIVPKMMGAGEVLVVSEDSISMISEGVASGKSVIVLRLAPRGLASKHYRFQKNLAAQGILRITQPDQLKEVLEEELYHRRTRMVFDDTQEIVERLRALL